MRKPIHNENLKIALFMGATIDEEYLNKDQTIDHYLLDMGKDRIQNERYWFSDTLKYHEDWNWIISVVGKCEELGADITMEERYCYINGKIFTDPVNTNKLLNVYYGIINFINKYNGRKK